MLTHVVSPVLFLLPLLLSDSEQLWKKEKKVFQLILIENVFDNDDESEIRLGESKGIYVIGFLKRKHLNLIG